MLRYTTTLYASSRPKTYRAHILCSTEADGDEVALEVQNLPRAHFMLHYYALCITARLIGNSVRRRKYIAKPYSTGSRYSALT